MVSHLDCHHGAKISLCSFITRRDDNLNGFNGLEFGYL